MNVLLTIPSYCYRSSSQNKMERKPDSSEQFTGRMIRDQERDEERWARCVGAAALYFNKETYKVHSGSMWCSKLSVGSLQVIKTSTPAWSLGPLVGSQ